MRFRRWGAYSAPPDPLAGFNGPTSKGREGKKGEGRKKDEREGKGNGGPTYKGREGGEGRGGEKGRGRVPPVITVSPGSRGARIVTVHHGFLAQCACK